MADAVRTVIVGMGITFTILVVYCIALILLFGF